MVRNYYIVINYNLVFITSLLQQKIKTNVDVTIKTVELLFIPSTMWNAQNKLEPRPTSPRPLAAPTFRFTRLPLSDLTDVMRTDDGKVRNTIYLFITSIVANDKAKVIL